MKAKAQDLFKYYSQHILLTVVAAAILILFLSMLSPFLEAICLAAIFSLGIYTLLEKVRHRYHMNGPPPLKLLISTLALLFVFIGSLFAVSILKLYSNFLGDHKDQTRAALQRFGEFGSSKADQFKPYLDSWLKVFGVHGVSYNTALESLPTKVFGAAAAFIAMVPDFILQSVVFLAMMLFFFISHRALYRFALRIKIFSAEDVARVTQIMKRSSYDSIMTNAMVGALQATILTVGSAIAGFSEWSLVFSVTFIFSFLPVIGGSSVAFLLAAVAFVANHYFGAGVMLVVGCVSGISDNILRSYLMSQSEQQTSSLLCFVSIIGAVYVFGFSGLFIGPFVITMASELMPDIFPKTSARRTIAANSKQTSSLA